MCTMTSYIIVVLLLIQYTDATPVSKPATTMSASPTTAVITIERSVILTIRRAEYIECKIYTNQASQTNTTWLHNGIVIKISTSNQSNDTHRLQLNGSPDEFGTYVCSMTDATGTIHSESKNLKPYLSIMSAPRNEGSISMDTEHKSNKSISITCVVTSYPRETAVTFRLGTKRVKENDRIRVYKTINDSATTVYVLKIDHVSYDDTGVYYCEATNTLLSEELPVKSLTVYVKCSSNPSAMQMRCPNNDKCILVHLCQTDPNCIKYNCEIPEKPTNTEIVHCSHDAVEIRWDKKMHIKSYSIEVSTADAMSTFYETLSNDATIRDMINNTLYNFTVYAVNNFGKSLPSKLSCKTPRIMKPSRVQSSELHNTKDGIQLNWKPPLDDGMDNKDGDLEYDVTYCTNKTDCHSVTTKETTIMLNAIKQNSVYKFNIKAINSAGQISVARVDIYRTPSVTSSSIINGASLLLLFTVTVVLFVPNLKVMI